MTVKTFKYSPVKHTLRRLRETRAQLHDQNFLSSLRDISEPDARALAREILGIYAFLEDSVSNAPLGSIFDRNEDSPLNSMLDQIANAYGVIASVPGTTGTTGLNAPAAMTLAGEGQILAVDRCCHVSVIGGLCLSGAEPVYFAPPFHHSAGVLLPPTPGEVGAFLDANPRAKALILTLPTYHGLMGDIYAIVGECRVRDVTLLVDEAHGAHFHFLSEVGFPPAAEDAGADLVTQSTHKLLSALNQGSLLHFNNPDLLRRYDELQALGFQSTSFSYPILLSIEHALYQMVTAGEQMWAQAAQLAQWLRVEAGALPGVQALDERIVDGYRIVGLDPTRVTLNIRDTGLTGHQVAEALFECGDIVELATPDVVLFLVSPSVTAEQVEATLLSLRRIAGRRQLPITEVFDPPRVPERVLTPRQATMCERRVRMPKEEAIGRVSAETIGCYPPGQAIFVAGERITREGVRYLTDAVSKGGHLKRVEDDNFTTIEILLDVDG